MNGFKIKLALLLLLVMLLLASVAQARWDCAASGYRFSLDTSGAIYVTNGSSRAEAGQFIIVSFADKDGNFVPVLPLIDVPPLDGTEPGVTPTPVYLKTIPMPPPPFIARIWASSDCGMVIFVLSADTSTYVPLMQFQAFIPKGG